MTKLKSLNELGDLYVSKVERTTVNENAQAQNEILLTDATNYLPKGSAPKTGTGFGKEKEELAKDTGPEQADGYSDDVKDPGSNKKAMKDAAAKQTQPKEKIQEEVDSASEKAKYNKPTFTMSKSKFDKLYEDALKGVPFINEEDDAAPITPAGDDMAAPEAPMGDENLGGTEEATVSHDEAIEMVEKLLAFLKKDVAHDIETGTLGDEEGAAPVGGEEEEPMEEAVDAQDLGHPGPGSHAKSEQLKDGHKIHKVGTLKPKGAASEQGGPKGGDGTVQKAKDFDKGLQKPTGNNQTGNLKVSKGTDNAFES